MTDNEIIKVLECCSKPYCNNNKCPLHRNTINTKDCITQMSVNALDLINRKNAELKRLTEEGEKLQYKLECLLCHSTGSKLSKSTYSLRTMEMYVNDYIEECCEEAQDEAIKEFAESLKDYYIKSKHYNRPHAHTMITFLFSLIDSLVEEKTGGKT